MQEKHAGRQRFVALSMMMSMTLTLACDAAPVDQRPVSQVTVRAVANVINTEQGTILIAEGRSDSGDPVPVSVEWTASGGLVAPLSDSTALFASDLPGSFVIEASLAEEPTVEGAASVAVVASNSPTVGIAISPSSVTLNAQSTQLFTVVATRADGSTYTPPVGFSATGGTIAAGLYTAGSTAGTYRVIAALGSGSLADTATVTVRAATLTSLSLSPATTTLAAGAALDFTVSGTWSNGATTAPAVTFTATGGTVTTAGRYTAGATAGNFRVIAQQQGGSLADTSLVTITSAPPPPPGSFNPYAHRPANYTVVETDYAFNTPIPSGGDTFVPDGSGWKQVFNLDGDMRRGSDPNSPISPGNVLEWRYRAGRGSPTSSAGFGHLYRIASTSITSWYISFPVWHDSNFEFNPVSNKMLGIWSQTGSNLMESKHFERDFLAWQFEAVPNVPYYRQSTTFGQSLTDSYFRGNWVNIEVQYVMSPTQGVLRVWAGRNDGSDGPEGRLILEYTGINIPLPGSLQELQLNSTWGGGNGPTARDSYRRIDHIFIAHP